MNATAVLERMTPKTIHSFTPLTDALAKLEITPFTPESVAAYKLTAREKLADKLVPPRPFQRFSAAEISGWVEEIILEVSSLGWAANETSFRYYREYSDRYPQYIATTWIRRPVLGFGMGNIFAAEIPEFVQHKMKQIANEVPAATFAVDELRSQKGTFDPFLVVICDTEEFYVEVWGTDDKDFVR